MTITNLEAQEAAANLPAVVPAAVAIPPVQIAPAAAQAITVNLPIKATFPSSICQISMETS